MKVFLIILMIGTTIVQANNSLTWYKEMNPGMMLKIDKSSVNHMKSVVSWFLPWYVNVGDMMNLPTNYTWRLNNFQVPGLEWDIKFDDITYADMELDMDQVKFWLIDGYEEGKGQLKFDFPALKHWEITTDMSINSWLFPSSSKLEFFVDDFDIDFSCQLKLDDKGYIDPVVYGVDINFGESKFVHENWFITIFMHQFFELGIVVIENSTWLLGDYMFSQILGPITDYWLSDYNTWLYIWNPFWGQYTWDVMWFDFKNTHDPILTSETMEFRFVGEFNANGKGCEVFNPEKMIFSDDTETYGPTSQLVISEAAANCLAEKVQHTRVGHYHLNKMALQALFNDSTDANKGPVDFNTTSVSDLMPMFQDKLGPNKNLEFFMSYKDMKVHFGRYHDWGSDIALEFTGRLQAKLLKGENQKLSNTEVFYDEFKMRMQIDVSMDNDVIFAKVTELRIHNDDKYGEKQMPIRNTMDLSRNEYYEILSQFKNTLKWTQSFLNHKVLPNGLDTPYVVDEFFTTLQFGHGAMYFLFEIEEGAGDTLQDTVDEIENYFDY